MSPVTPCPLQLLQLGQNHHLCGGEVEPAWLFVVDFVVPCVAAKCDHLLCPVQFLFFQKMTEFKEQCICIKLLLQIGKIVAETFQMLTFAFREEAMRQSVVLDCSAESRSGMTSVTDTEYSGCLPSGKMYRNVEHIYGIWHESRCITIHKLANELGTFLVYAVKFWHKTEFVIH